LPCGETFCAPDLNCFINNGSAQCVDPCEHHTALDDWSSQYNQYGNCDGSVVPGGWYSFYLGQTRAHITETCEEKCGRYYLKLTEPHPTEYNQTVTLPVYGGSWCSYTSSDTIKVKLCYGDYYVYKLQTLPGCNTAYCAGNVLPSVCGEACQHYTELNDNWLSQYNIYGNSYCRGYSSPEGWYRMFVGQTSAQIPETCVQDSRCSSYSHLQMKQPHPTQYNQTVTRSLCYSYGSSCCSNTYSYTIKVKLCYGDYYVYKLQRLPGCQDCVIINGTAQCGEACQHYSELNDNWLSEYNIYGNSYCRGYSSPEGWYRMFVGQTSAQIPETCVQDSRCSSSYNRWKMTQPHPTQYNQTVTRSLCYSYGSSCCSSTSSYSIKVKLCYGDFYVYKLQTLPGCNIAYCAGNVMLVNMSVPLKKTHYTVLNDDWLSEYNVNGNSLCYGNYYSSNWYRMFVGQSSAQIPETCVQESRCSSLNRVWARTPHPVHYNESVSIYTSYAMDSYYFYVYKLPRLPVSLTLKNHQHLPCGQGFCPSDHVCINGNGTFQCVDGCQNYTVLNDDWLSEYNVNGYSYCGGNYYPSDWYRMFVGQSSAQIPETCVQESRCSSLNRYWVRTPHPVHYNESVTLYASYARDSDCYYSYYSYNIMARLCYGDFYVYKLPRLPGCGYSYCPDHQHLPCGQGFCPSDHVCINGNGTFQCVDGCQHYTVLNDDWLSDYNVNGNSYCGGNYYPSDWYRMFVGQSSAEIPETCVQESRCSSLNRYWVRTPHPVHYNESVTLYASYARDSDCYYSYYSYNIMARLCYGDFYVYKLPRLPGCGYSYCPGKLS
uniref:UMOD/GP2/OIT3-like D8C domain-containing protein n=1 Tax=Oryzias latipes TaxID=8090 RepID=A0A3B3HSG1_ORYLA